MFKFGGSIATQVELVSLDCFLPGHTSILHHPRIQTAKWITSIKIHKVWNIFEDISNQLTLKSTRKQWNCGPCTWQHWTCNPCPPTTFDKMVSFSSSHQSIPESIESGTRSEPSWNTLEPWGPEKSGNPVRVAAPEVCMMDKLICTVQCGWILSAVVSHLSGACSHC